MAKKKRHRKSPTRHSPVPRAPAQSHVLVTWNSRLNIFIFTSSAVMLLCLIYVLNIYSSFDNFIRQRSPYTLAIYAILVTELIVVKFRLDQQIGIESKRNVDKAKRLVLHRGIFELTHLAVLFIPIIYLSGLTNRVAATLTYWLPSLGTRVLKLFLSAATFLVPGILVNAGYDLIKIIFKRIRG